MPDRDVTFHFEGRRLRGTAGEPLAKALFRNGVRTLSYSVKYMRPRGIHCARGRCVMCHMEVDGVPGVPTCVTPLEDGMRVRRENFRPFYAVPLVAAVRRLRFPAGFYYRRFTRPALLRKLFLGSIRRMAGVGRIVIDRDQSAPAAGSASGSRARYDVVVVGGGLSGMSAALAAGAQGASVLLVDEYALPGGHSLGAQADGEHAAARDGLMGRITMDVSIDCRWKTSALGFYAPDTLLLGNNGAPRRGAGGAGAVTTVRADTFVFATGANDVIPLFENNDIPGVFGPRGMRLLLERDAFAPGKRAVVWGAGPELDAAVHLLGSHGIEIAALLDAGGADRSDAPGLWRIDNATVVEAAGSEWITGVKTADGSGKYVSVSCDILCAAFTGQGAYELPYQAGFTFELDRTAIEMNRTLRPTSTRLRVAGGAACFVVGEAAGTVDWREKIAAGEAAGRLASESLKTG